MAEEKKKAAPKKTAAPKAKVAAEAKAAPDGPHCKADKCKQPVRAKGYCRKHFIAWRRGKVGKKHSYKICSKEGCRKPATFNGRCAEHTRSKKAAEGAPAAA